MYQVEDGPTTTKDQIYHSWKYLRQQVSFCLVCLVDQDHVLLQYPEFVVCLTAQVWQSNGNPCEKRGGGVTLKQWQQQEKGNKTVVNLAPHHNEEHSTLYRPLMSDGIGPNQTLWHLWVCHSCSSSSPFQILKQLPLCNSAGTV